MQGRAVLLGARRTLIALTALLAVFAVWGVTASYAAGPADGVAHAEAAGIKLDPGAAAAMEAAPVGSCYNDPTLAKCPPSTRVEAPTSDVGGSSFSFGWSADPMAGIARTRRAPTRAAARHGAPRARTSAVAYCDGGVNSGSPYTWSNQARMKAQNYCTPNVERSDVYLALYKYDLNQDAWRLITSDYWDWQSTGVTHEYELRGPYCASGAQRNWKGQITSYGVYQGVWEAGEASNIRALYCNYP